MWRDSNGCRTCLYHDSTLGSLALLPQSSSICSISHMTRLLQLLGGCLACWVSWIIQETHQVPQNRVGEYPWNRSMPFFFLGCSPHPTPSTEWDVLNTLDFRSAEGLLGWTDVDLKKRAAADRTRHWIFLFTRTSIHKWGYPLVN